MYYNIGEIQPVDGTLFDLKQPTLIKERFAKISQDAGFDDNFVLNKKSPVSIRFHIIAN